MFVKIKKINGYNFLIINYSQNKSYVINPIHKEEIDNIHNYLEKKINVYLEISNDILHIWINENYYNNKERRIYFNFYIN